MNTTFRFGRALLGAALIIGVSATLAWLEPRYISKDTASRLVGALLGAVVVVHANAIPKFLSARARRDFPSVADQAARRFAGWSMVLGGIAYMLAWLFAPIGSAALIGGAVLAASVIAAFARCRRIGLRSAGR